MYMHIPVSMCGFILAWPQARPQPDAEASGWRCLMWPWIIRSPHVRLQSSCGF